MEHVIGFILSFTFADTDVMHLLIPTVKDANVLQFSRIDDYLNELLWPSTLETIRYISIQKRGNVFHPFQKMHMDI